MICIKKICVIFLAWMSIVCGVFVFLLGTNIGTYLTLTGITYCIPGLKFDSVSGGWGKFNVTHVVYENSIGIIKVDACDVILNLKYIWNKQIYINHLFLEDVCIKIKKNDTTNKLYKKYESIKLDNILSIPFPIILKNIVLNNTRVHLNNITLELIKLDTGGLIFQKNLLTVLPINIKGAVLNISNVKTFNITTNAIDIYKYSNQWNIRYLLKSLSSKLLMKLPSFNLPVNIIVKDITGENFYIFNNHNSYIINNFCLQTYLCNQTINIKLNIELPHGYINAIGNIIFKDHYPINITVNYMRYDSKISNQSMNMAKKGVSKIKLVIAGELYNEICFYCDFLGFVSTAHVLLKTKIMQCGTPINVSVVGRKIPLSFLGLNDYLIEEIDVSVSGEIRNYCIQIISQLSNSKFSSLVNMVVNAQGDVNSCSISKLRITISEEYLDIQGVVNWDDTISWNSVCVLNKINISQKWLKYPVNLSGNISMQGHVCPNAWDIMISDLNISGSMENNSISCVGVLYNNSIGVWKIPTLLIKWGPNVLEIQEDLKKDSTFNIVFSAPDCNVIVPGLNGSVFGKFKLYSPVKYSPRLLLSIDACSLYWSDKNLNVDKIMVHGDICCDTVTQSKIFFQADQIKCGILSLHQLIMQGQGNVKEHYLNLIAHGDMLSGQVKLCGNLDLFHKIWRSKINKTSIVTPTGTWKLMQDMVLTYQHLTRKVILNSHDWEIINCTMPISSVLKTKILNKMNDIFKDFNAVSLKILLPELINVDTVRICCTCCDWILGTPLPNGIISLSVKKCNFKCTIEDPSNFPITINNITTKIVLTQTTLYCKWFMNIGHDDQNHGSFKITKSDTTSKVVGNIYMENTSLLPFCNSLISLKEPINGLLNLNIYFYGYQNHLKIYGTAQLHNFNINKPDTPFFVKNSQLFIKFFGDHALLNGIIDTDYGCRLHVNGNITNFDSISNIRAFFKIRGHQINFCISSEIRMKISPDITCIITSEKIHIAGNIEIPWAHIAVKEYSKNIINISSEEILLDDNFQPILNNDKNLFISFSSNINVCLGNDVNFNGLGLRAKLRGNLEIEYNNNHLALTGHIDIPSGFFQAYGQNLMIQKGQLLFSGAINQPYIDIEAICDPSSIKEGSIVGTRITGTFSQPKIEILSNSLSLSSKEITSYLLGDSKNAIIFNTDTNIVTSLLIGASVRNSEKFINKIGKVFGVQGLTLNTQDIGTAPLVALSGYIAPGFQINYGIGIFDLLTTITARYHLCSQLYLEVTSGSNQQAIDLLYKFDF